MTYNPQGKRKSGVAHEAPLFLFARRNRQVKGGEILGKLDE